MKKIARIYLDNILQCLSNIFIRLFKRKNNNLILSRRDVMSTKFLNIRKYNFKDRLNLVGIVRKDTLDADREVNIKIYCNRLYI